MTLWQWLYFIPFKTEPETHKRTPWGQMLGSIQLCCLVHSIHRQLVSTITPCVHIGPAWAEGLRKFPLPCLMVGEKKEAQRKLTRWLSGQMQEAMSLANVHPVWITHLQRTIRWMSHQTGSWAFHIFFFFHSTLPYTSRRVEIPWLKQHKFI